MVTAPVSSNAFEEASGHHRPDINRRLFKVLVSGVSQRRAAKILGCSKQTVGRRRREMGDEANAMHVESLHSEMMKTPCVQLDVET